MTLIVTPPKTLEASWTGPQTATPQHKTPDCPVVIHPGRPDISGYPGHPGYVGAGAVTSATGTPLLLRLLVRASLGTRSRIRGGPSRSNPYGWRHCPYDLQTIVGAAK